MKEKKRNSGRKLHKLHVAIVAMVAAVLVAGGSAFLPKSVENVESTVTADAAKSTIDTGYIASANYRYTDNSWQSIPGIDVAIYSANCVHDWNALEKSGCKFIMIALGGYQAHVRNDYYITPENFAYIVKIAHEHNIKVGAYYWSEATTKKEADVELAVVKQKLGSTKLDLPLFLDIEMLPSYFWSLKLKNDKGQTIKSGDKDNGYAMSKYYADICNYWISEAKKITPNVGLYTVGNATTYSGYPGGYLQTSEIIDNVHNGICLWDACAGLDGYNHTLQAMAYAPRFFESRLTIHQYAGNVWPSYTYVKDAISNSVGYVDLDMAFVKRPANVTGVKLDPNAPVITWNVTRGVSYQVTLYPKGGTPTTESASSGYYMYNAKTFKNGGTISVKAIRKDEYGFEAESYSPTSIEIPAIVELTSKNTTITLSETTMDYTGKDVKPSTVTVKYGKTTLKSGADYTIAYPSDIKSAGKKTISITGKGKYSGKVQVSYTIKDPGIDIKSTTVSLNKTKFEYTGSPVIPVVTVKYQGKTLVMNTDYTINMPIQSSPGTYNITVKGIGKYTGTRNVSFTINNARSINSTDVKFTGGTSSFTYSGAAITPGLTINDTYGKLVLNTDYTLTYQNNRDAGTATILINGKGKYVGTKTVNFTIKGDDIKKATVTFDSVQYYTGSKIKPAVTVKNGDTTLKQGTDYTITYGENTKVGNNSGKITINGKGRYGGSSTSKTFNILARTFTVTPNYTSYEYKPNYGREPGVVVTDPVFGEVPKDQYTVKYYNNRAIGGKAKIIVTGKGAYEGVTQTVYFVIKPVVDSFVVKNNAAGSLKITDIKTSLTDPDTRYDTTGNTWVYGVEVQYADNANFRNAIDANNPENVRDSAFLTKGKTIYVRVRAWIMVDGVKYGNWVTSQLTLTK